MARYAIEYNTVINKDWRHLLAIISLRYYLQNGDLQRDVNREGVINMLPELLPVQIARYYSSPTARWLSGNVDDTARHTYNHLSLGCA